MWLGSLLLNGPNGPREDKRTGASPISPSSSCEMRLTIGVGSGLMGETERSTPETRCSKVGSKVSIISCFMSRALVFEVGQGGRREDGG
jgi:hypothetical protein